MKTYKPFRLGLLTRSFENDGQCQFVVSIFVYFPFEAPEQLLPDIAMWKFLAEEIGKDAMLDMGMPKVRSEVLVDGYAIPPGGKEATACKVKMTFAEREKELYVVGDRIWKGSTPSEPKPFERMRIDWAHAFGGESFPDNPAGKGADDLEVDGVKYRPLPNIENPKDVVASPNQQVVPASFNGIDPTWSKHFEKMGTYDEAWLKTRFPGFAEDMDWGYFNIAPIDQQFPKPFAGTEAFSFENMHPKERLVESRLPGIKARAFIQIKKPNHPDLEFREIGMKLDTVRLFPHAKRGVCVFRGVTPNREDDAADIDTIMIAADRLDEPKTIDYYRERLADRLGPRGAMLALRDRDLVPMPDPENRVYIEEDDWNDTEHLVKRDDIVMENVRRGMAEQLEETREKIKELGFDPDEHMPKELPPKHVAPTLENLADYVEKTEAEVELKQKEAEEQAQKAQDEMRAILEAEGIDVDEALAEAQKDGGGPPPFTADGELQRLRDIAELCRNAGADASPLEAAIADPGYEQQLRVYEEKIRDAYRRFTHFFPLAPLREAAASEELRKKLIAGRDRGESFEDIDLTGADLSNLDLSGLNLTRALMERTDLTGSDLSRANLTGATLARSTLKRTKLTGATVVGTNFGKAVLDETEAEGVAFQDNSFMEAELKNANLAKSTFKNVEFITATFEGCNFNGTSIANARFIQTELRAQSFEGADLHETLFMQCSLDESDFTDADLTQATMMAVTAKHAKFGRAKLDNARFVGEGCDLTGATFDGASMVMTNMRGVPLRKATFDGAMMPQADLSECDLEEASLYRVTGPEARFSKANLRHANMKSARLIMALLDKAELIGADLRGANLFRADMAKIRADKSTNLKDALLTQVRVVARNDPPEESP